MSEAVMVDTAHLARIDAMVDAQAAGLAAIDAEIAVDRVAYLRATWAGHAGEAEYYADEVQRLIFSRDALVCAPFALGEG